jgi:hypothetical protein
LATQLSGAIALRGRGGTSPSLFPVILAAVVGIFTYNKLHGSAADQTIHVSASAPKRK